MRCIKDMPELSRLSRNRTLGFIKKYFAILEDKAKLKTQVLDRCRGREQLEEMIAAEDAEAALQIRHRRGQGLRELLFPWL